MRALCCCLQACCACRGPWHGKQRCKTAAKQQFGRAELSVVATQLHFTRCDVCGVAVERIEVCIVAWSEAFSLCQRLQLC